jgi:hypothetical protein
MLEGIILSQHIFVSKQAQITYVNGQATMHVDFKQIFLRYRANGSTGASTNARFATTTAQKSAAHLPPTCVTLIC